MGSKFGDLASLLRYIQIVSNLSQVENPEYLSPMISMKNIVSDVSAEGPVESIAICAPVQTSPMFKLTLPKYKLKNTGQAR